MRGFLRTVFTVAAIGVVPFALVHGQAANEQGIKLYGTYQGGDFDKIALANNHLDLRIPLVDYPQRGGKLALTYIIRYHDAIWNEKTTCVATTSICVHQWEFDGQPGVEPVIAEQAPPPLFIESQSVGGVNPNCVADCVTWAYSLWLPDGSAHPLGQIGSTSYETLDATGIRVDNVSNPTVTLPDGTRYSGQIMEDTNGNQINFGNPAVDTLGRTIPLPGSGATQDFSGCTGILPTSSANLWIVPGANGSQNTFKFCFVEVRIYTAHFHIQSTPTEQYFEPNGDYSMLQSIVLPNGAGAWTFDYSQPDANGVNWGDLLKITLPTGGTISYTWSHPTAGCTVVYGKPGATSAVVITRTVDANDGAGPHTWNYAGLGGAVTDPAGNDTVHTFTYFSGCAPYETQTDYYSGSGTGRVLLKTEQITYSQNPSPMYINLQGGGPPINLFPVLKTTIWPNGKQKKEEYQYDFPNHTFTFTSPFGDTFTGNYGRRTSVNEYDYGDGKPGALLKSTQTAYWWWNSPSYQTYNILDLPSSITVYNGAGVQVSQTLNEYDLGSAPLPSGITTSFDSAPPNGAFRGNLTASKQWIDSSTSTVATPNCPVSFSNGFLPTTKQYFDTGTPSQSTDPCGHKSTFQYSSLYAGAYLTSSCDALNHCTTMDYDLNTGAVAAITDPNSQKTQYTYDDLGRVTVIKFPDGGETDAFYPDPNTIEKKTLQSSGASGNVWIDQFTYFDGLARPYQTRLLDPEGDVSTDTTYDGMGRVQTVSNPHRSVASATDGITTTSYDVFGRVASVEHPDHNILKTDYSDPGTVVLTDETGRQRREITDALGRLVEVDEPGTPSIGSQAQGSLTVNGSVLGAVTVSITGADRSIIAPDAPSPCPSSGCPRIYDSGSACININGVGYCAGYDQGVNATAALMAGAISSAINSGSGSAYVTATPSVANVILTSRSGVSMGSVSISFSASSDDPTDFPTGSYHGAVAAPVYDSGTVSASVNGFTGAPVSYGAGANTSAGQVASALVATLNAAGSPITVQPSGAISYNSFGSEGNTTVTVTSTSSNPSLFPQGSFSGIATLAGGVDPDPTGINHPLPTFYSYDLLNNLTRVEQHGDSTDPAQWRVRTFTYNSLSRLMKSSNPESGTISYAYDADGNLLQKTSPAPNQTGTATQTISYCYDPLHRPTGKGYGVQSCPLNSPAVSYTYDQGALGIGHMTSLTDQAGTGSYTYDAMGRIATEARVISGVSKSMGYVYNPDGSLKSLTYPSSRVVNYTYDSAGRPLSALDANGVQYVTNATYWPSGATYQQWTPRVYLRHDLNNRLQLAHIYADNGKVVSFFLDKTYNYGTLNNGTVLSITNNKDANRTQNFTYDPLGRITAGWTNASTGTDSWGENYAIDAWGNVKIAPMAGKASGGNFQCTADGSNRSSCLSYDSAGNVTANGPVGYSYDPENRLLSAGGMSYTYDAEGERLEKIGCSNSMLYWYGAPGVVAESDLAGNMQHEYVFFNGKRVARVDTPGNSVHYYLSDHLNSTSMVVSAAGIIEEESDYSPYGTEYVITGPGSNHYKFNGKERDSESGLDDFGARYYASKLARWMSPDWSASPEPVPYAKMGNPQSLNLYSFVTNNPLSNTDLDGHARHQIGGMSAGYKCSMGMTTFCQEAAEQQQQQQQQSQSQPQATVPVFVGQRPIQNKWAQFFSVLFTFHKAYHSYYRLTGDDGVTHQFEVLGDRGSSHNQQVRDTIQDPTQAGRASHGTEHTVYATEAQAAALIKGSEYFLSHPCPTCTGGQQGYNLVFHNSNSFVYNMLSSDPAGRIPPPSAPFITPAYIRKADDWYPEP